MAQPQPRWTTAGEVAQVDLPPGGSTGQVLAKTSDVDREVAWTTVAGTGDVVGPASATTDNLAVFADETGKLLKDGGAPGGGGSFLSANTARVDPSGSDETGTVGDLNKPFLTVQAAVDALATANGVTSVVLLPAISPDATGQNVTVDFSNAAFQEPNGNWSRLYFVGVQSDTALMDTLTIVGQDADAPYFLTLKNCSVNLVVGDDADESSGDIYIILDNAAIYGLISGARDVWIRSLQNSGIIGSVTAGRDIYLSGLLARSAATLTAASAQYVGMANCKPRYDEYDWIYRGYFIINAPTAGAWIANSIVKDITCDSGTFIDSRATGTITGDITYEDVLLKGVPPGGTTGQALEKASNDDFDTEWASLV